MFMSNSKAESSEGNIKCIQKNMLASSLQHTVYFIVAANGVVLYDRTSSEQLDQMIMLMSLKQPKKVKS